MTNPVQDSLLYPLFDHLRQSDVPLGVGDYLLALQLLREPAHLESVEQIKFTCRLIWAKSLADQELFDQAFERLVRPRIRALRPQAPDARAHQRTTSSTSDQPRLEPPPEQREGQISRTEQAEELFEMGTLPLTPSDAGTDREQGPQPTGIYQFTLRPPIGLREMAGIWRHLREMRREGPLVELDVEATIDDICRNGFALEPRLRPRRRNQVEMLILLDRSRTMTAYSPLVDALVESIQRSGQLGETDICYFREIPRQHLSLHPGLVDHRPVEMVLSEKAAGKSVLIIGDAGAAQGGYSGRLVRDARRFLQTLHGYTYLHAWLNPLPRNRWQDTSAAEFAQMIPMFPVDHDGLVDAVNVLRGLPYQKRM